MVFKILKANKNYFLILAGYLLIIYLPYLLKGGFIVDDWGVPYMASKAGTFWENYTSWFPLFSNRPVAPLILTFFSRIYGEWPALYIITNLFLWVASVIITGLVLKKYTNKIFFFFFFFFALVPVIATTVIFSTVMQITATFSFFLWAVSFYCLDKYLTSDRKLLLFISYLSVLIGLLDYEIIFPLLTINALWPFYIRLNLQKTKENYWILIVKFLSPIASVFAVTFTFQKLIMPHFMPVTSRLDFKLSLDNIITPFIAWLHTSLYDFPIMIYSSILYGKDRLFGSIEFLIFLTLALIISFFLKNKHKEDKINNFIENNWIIVIFILTFFVSSAIYILSGRTAQVIGYENRGLSVTWFALSLIIAFFGFKFFKTKFHYILIIILALCFNTFTLERNNYIKSAELQENIFADSNRKIAAQSIPGSDRIYILGNVPQFVSGNFINEEVFYNFWDFGYALALKNPNKNVFANPFTYSKILDKKLSYDNQNITIDGDWTAPYDKAWYYEYNQISGSSTLIKIRDKEHFEKIIKNIPQSEKYISPPSFFWQTRDQVLNNPEYFSRLIDKL